METTSYYTARLVSRINALCPHGSLPRRALRFWVIKCLSFDEAPEGRLLGVKGPWIGQEEWVWGGKRGGPGTRAPGTWMPQFCQDQS